MSEFTRRQFVKKVGVGAAAVTAAGAAPRPGAAAHHEDSHAKGGDDYDVIVIGGGFAGVTAARDTSRAGLRTLILEARNRLGGRTFTADFAGHKVELGGTWVHWVQPHVWSEIMRYDLDVVETPGANPDEIVALRDGKSTTKPAAEVWEALYAATEKMFAAVPELLPEPYRAFETADAWREIDRLTLAQGIEKAPLSPYEAYLDDSVWGVMLHNYADVGGLLDPMRWYALSGYSTGVVVDAATRYKLKVGTRGLIDRMIEEGKPDVRVGTPVRSISHGKDSVTVVTEEGDTLRARAAIVTVPLNVLKDVKFSPTLSSAKLAASREEHAGHGTKVYAQVRGDLGNIFLMAPSRSPLAGAFTYARDEASTLLVGFGPSREILDVNDREAVGAVIRSFLPEAEVTSSFGYDWILDPYSRGTWCMFKPNQASLYWKELQRPEGRLFFASADSANGWRGFIDGAIERGLRVAAEVSQLLG